MSKIKSNDKAEAKIDKIKSIMITNLTRRKRNRLKSRSELSKSKFKQLNRSLRGNSNKKKKGVRESDKWRGKDERNLSKRIKK